MHYEKLKDQILSANPNPKGLDSLSYVLELLSRGEPHMGAADEESIQSKKRWKRSSKQSPPLCQ